MAKHAKPLVSVFMTARNAEFYIEEAVRSILDQTLTDFEFLVIDDASSDSTWDRLQAMSDERLVLLKNAEQLGQQANYNRLLEMSRGKYLAKMDADDISSPERLQIQVSFMEAHPALWACSSFFKVLSGDRLYEATRPWEPGRVRSAILFRNYLGHPFVMFRGDVWREHVIRYNLKAHFAEDYELWLRLMLEFPKAEFANVPEFLGYYRIHPGMISMQKQQEQQQSVFRAQVRAFKKLGIPTLDPDVKYHTLLFNNELPAEEHDLAALVRWVNKLNKANDSALLFEPELFNYYLAESLNSILVSLDG